MEDQKTLDERGDRRMALAQSMAGGISHLLYSDKYGVEKTDFVLILADRVADSCSIVGNFQPARLLEVLKYQLGVIEKAIAEGRFDVTDITNEIDVGRMQ